MHAWQVDPYQWRDVAQVLACEPDGDRFRVATSPTVLFPEGGGQPADHGWIGAATVVDVRKVGGAVVHWTDAPVPLGEHAVEVDGARRFDHMQQHTGQHLLTATLLDAFGVGTTSFRLGPATTAIELDAPSLSPAQLVEVEARVNAAIRRALPVGSVEVAHEDLAARGVRSRGLPEGFDGPVRLVEIEGIDVNTCGGTHVRHLGELQALKLVRVEGVGARGCRLYFLVGGRVLAALSASGEREAALTRLLSAGASDHAALVERALDDRRRLAARVDALEEARGDAIVDRLVGESGQVLAATLTGAPARVLQVAAARLAGARPGAVVLLAAPEPSGVGGPVVIAAPEATLAGVVHELTARLELRGGGRGRWQGRAGRLGDWEQVVAGVRARLTGEEG